MLRASQICYSHIGLQIHEVGMNDDDWDGEPHCPQNARYTFHLVAVRGYYSEQAAMSGTGQRRSGSPHTCSQSERLDNGVEQDHEDLQL